MTRTGEVGWPTEAELELLRACLLSRAEGADAWRRWRSMVDFDDIGFACLRQIPLAWRNLGDAVADDPAWGRVRGIYRRSWTANQLSMRSAAGMVAALENAGIKTLILKGAAASVLNYRDLGARWMADVDVLVDVSQLADASRVITSAGWASRLGDPLAVAAVRHSTDFNSPDGRTGLDLHWNALWLPAPDEDFWTAAIPLELFGVHTRALCDTDQVLHACVHGLEWNPQQLHWIADVHTVIGRGAVDWQRFVERARERRVSVFCSEALEYVSSELGSPVPDAVLTELRSIPAGAHERRAFRAIMKPPSPLRTVRVYREMYRRQCELDVPGPRSTSYIDYLRRAFGAASNAQLLGVGVRRLFGVRARA